MLPLAHPVDLALRGALDSLVPRGARVLAACSGGADSVALAHALARAGVPSFIGHVDHGLRPESAHEAAEVERLARELGVPFFLERLEGLRLSGRGLEGAAREARYAALSRLALQAGAPVVAVAHTRRDVAETLLLRLARGAGPGALAGPRASRPLGAGLTLVRPLLEVSRADTESYCRDRGLSFVVDPSNADPARGRGHLRNAWEVLRGLNPRLEDALAGAAHLFADDDDFLEGLAAAEVSAGLDCARLAALHPALQRRVLLRAAHESAARPERRHLEMLRDLLQRPGSIDLPGGRATSDGVRLSFAPAARDPATHPAGGRSPPAGRLAIAGPGRYGWGRRSIEIASLPAQPHAGTNEGIAVDTARAPFPWTLRTRSDGDRFRQAHSRSKKVADLWIDAHVGRERRQDLALLADANGILFWVERLRPGEPCSGDMRAPVTFRLHPEMDAAGGGFGQVRRADSASATMAGRPVEEPR